MRQSTNSISSGKKQVRDTYAQHVKQLSGLDKQKINLTKIININFGEDALILVSKSQLLIYSILNMKLFYSRQGFFWDAIFIPSTDLIALIQHDGTQRSKRTLKILSLQKDQFVATVIVKFEIQSIKTSQHCICLAGSNQLSVIHFPSLKPICHQVAGSGFEGLTLAHQNQKKGSIVIHNFSSVQTLRARRKSFQSRKKSALTSMIASQPRQNPKKVIQIKAHQQYVCLIRLSPNGSRVATASNKGTMIRIFLTQSGKLWEELRVGYELATILDMHFYQQGNVISCLTDKGMVYLFNTKLQTYQQKAQSQKRGYKIYQQQNPKSMFSFLSFLYNNFGNQHHFAYFQLVRPKQQQANQAVVVPSDPNSASVKPQQKGMQVIVQQPENSNIKQGQRQPSQAQLQKAEQVYEELIQKQLQEVNGKIQKSSSFTSSHKLNRTKSLLQKLNILQNKKDNYDYVAKVYNTVSRVFIGGNNFIWVVKGPYVFSLKYDPFNGGQMYHKQTLRFC